MDETGPEGHYTVNH